MSAINKLFGVWFLSKTVSSTTPLFMRMLAGIAAITVCAIFTAFLGALLIGAGVWFLYTQLIGAGVSAHSAMLMVAELILLLIVIMAMVIQHFWHKVRATSHRLMYVQSPVAARFANVVDAFMRGYNSPDK